MDDLQEQLPCSGIEDKDGAVDGLGRQVSFEGLVDGDSVDVGVIHKPDHLVVEQVGVVLGVQVRLGGLGGVQLQAFADALTQDVQGGVGFHYFVHCLQDQCADTREPVAEG